MEMLFTAMKTSRKLGATTVAPSRLDRLRPATRVEIRTTCLRSGLAKHLYLPNKCHHFISPKGQTAHY